MTSAVIRFILKNERFDSLIRNLDNGLGNCQTLFEIFYSKKPNSHLFVCFSFHLNLEKRNTYIRMFILISRDQSAIEVSADTQ